MEVIDDTEKLMPLKDFYCYSSQEERTHHVRQGHVGKHTSQEPGAFIVISMGREAWGRVDSLDW